MAKAKRQIKNTTPVTINGEEMFLKYNVFAIKKMNELGVDLTKFDENNPMTIDEAMEKETAVRNIELTAEQVFRLVKAVNK